MVPTEQCSQCGQANVATETACRACGGPLVMWQTLPPEIKQQYTCWRCGGMYTQIVNTPNKGTGCVVVALGIIFAPVLIGIIFIIYGVSMMNETQSYWQCRSCGLTLPG